MQLHGEGSSSGKVTGHETGAKVEQVQEGLKCSPLMMTDKRSCEKQNHNDKLTFLTRLDVEPPCGPAILFLAYVPQN